MMEVWLIIVSMNSSNNDSKNSQSNSNVRKDKIGKISQM